MNGDNTMARVKVGENNYTVELFNPMDGMAFGIDVSAALGPALSGVYEATREGGDASKVFEAFSTALRTGDFKGIFKRTFAQCYTPENARLSNEVEFNRWFRKYPGDMYELAVRATFELVKDFFPSQLATIASAFTAKLNTLQTQTQSPSQSPTDSN